MEKIRHKLFQVIPGMRLGTLYRALHDNGFAVDAPYLGRLTLLAFMGIMNSILARLENLQYGERIRATGIGHPPLFVIGHMRSGTTHLHNLLSHDESFDAPSAYQAMFPHHFCSSQKQGYRIFNRLAPLRRPMDNVAFRARSPHEDEFALAALCAVSPYMRFLFPRTETIAHRSWDMSCLSPDALEAWKSSMLDYLKKLSFWKDNKRLVLKSPPHATRISLLLELFPGAQFVHIIRNPYHVFVSARHLWAGTLSRVHLQKASPEMVDEIILSWYTGFFSLFQRERAFIPSGALHELKFEDLERDPVGTLEGLYDALGLSGFQRLRQRLQPYLKSLEGYKRNEYQLQEADRLKVRARCREVFQLYGYPL